MAHCWELRGCYKDKEMTERCPHNQPDSKCPADCMFSQCTRPTRKVTTDPLLMLRSDLDFTKCVKNTCNICEFFLKNGPTVQG